LPSTACSSTWTRPLIFPHFLPIGSGDFESDLYLYTYRSSLNPFILTAYTACEDGTELSVPKLNIQTQGSQPKERMKHSEQSGFGDKNVRTNLLFN
jgi:hypothetical protein